MIPVYEPQIGELELSNVIDCVKGGMLSGTLRDNYIGEFERLVAEQCGVKHGIVTTSGTTALALAVASLGLDPGDEVIVPAFTNIATAFAVVYAGCKPVFIDSERLTWNLDVDQIRDLITPRTKAVIPVHIYGHPVDMDPVMKVAEEYGLKVIEDAAEAQGAEYKGRSIGGIGHIGCLSFFINKIITTGEGGMVVTDDDTIAEQARLLKNLAYSSRDKFIHEQLGFNFRMSNMHAALGPPQMKRLTEILERKRQVADWYAECLKEVPGLRLPVEMPWAKNVYWVYGVVLSDDMPSTRVVRDRLTEAGIETRNFFYPLHRQPVFINGGISGLESLPVSEWLWKHGLYLPSGPGLSREQVGFICDSFIKSLEE